MKVLVTEKLSEHRYKTPEGYLVCVDAILARTGKQVYKHNQVYDDSTDEITDVEVDRKPEQVFSPQAIASFENKPLTIQHPNEPVTIRNHKELCHGFVRDVRRAVKRNGQILTGSKRPTQLQDGDQEVLVGNIIVTTAEAIEAIENGLEFLSCGYDCDITQTDTPEQINIRGNHVALCDNPRAGITMLQDNIEPTELPMKHIVKVLTDAVIEQLNKVKTNDAINYVVMCEQLYNGIPVKSRAPWIVFRTEDKRKAEQFVKENNAKITSYVGFSKHYYIK